MRNDCAQPGGIPTGTLAPSPLSTAGRSSDRIFRVAPGPMRRGLRIAIGGMPSGPRRRPHGNSGLSCSPFSSWSPAARRRTRRPFSDHALVPTAAWFAREQLRFVPNG